MQDFELAGLILFLHVSSRRWFLISSVYFLHTYYLKLYYTPTQWTCETLNLGIFGEDFEQLHNAAYAHKNPNIHSSIGAKQNVDLQVVQMFVCGQERMREQQVCSSKRVVWWKFKFVRWENIAGLSCETFEQCGKVHLLPTMKNWNHCLVNGSLDL